MIQDALARLLDGRDLDREQARAVDGRDHGRRGDAGPDRRLPRRAADQGRDARRDRRLRRGDPRPRLAVAPQRDDLVDTAGTGGDGQATINISTAAALVAAAAGAASPSTATAPSRRHRARPTCSRRSASRSTLPPERIARSIDELGFGFLFAPTHHPGSGTLRRCGRELATRTVFNVLGPLTNPAGARAQLVGVYDPAARARRSRRCSPGSARGGLSSSTVRSAWTSSRPPARTSSARSSTAGCASARSTRSTSASPRCAPEELRGGSPAENAARIRAVFSGEERGAKRDAILLNAAGAIAAGGHAEDLRDGLERRAASARLRGRRRAARGARRLLPAMR